MIDILTTIAFTVMTLLSATACGFMVWRFRRPGSAPKLRRVQYSLVGVCTVLALLLLLYRTFVVYGIWQPVHAHVDGLLLIAALLSIAVLFLQAGRRLPEFSGFALPLLTLIFAWGICASRWTHLMFRLDTVWDTFHLASVYLGTLSVALGAVAGGMYLYVQHRLRHKHDLPPLGRLASLESLERLIVRGATLGFVLLTLGLITGVVVLTEGPTRLGGNWWFSPKVLLATAAWAIYALLMNVRHTTHFRGARAAWLSIAGLVLLLATFAAVSRMQEHDRGEAVGPVNVTAPEATR